MNRFALGFGSVGLVLVVLASGCDEDIEATPAPDGGATTGDSSTTDAPASDAANEAAAACTPQPLGSFAPAWKPPVGFNQRKCTPTQVQTLASCVWTHPGRNETACKAFFDDPANDECQACGTTNSAGATLGAIISNGASVQANYAGCIALVAGDTSATGCGAKVQAYELCLDQACVASCPVPPNEFSKFEACQAAAKTGVCKTYSDAAACANGLLGPGGAAADCAPVVADFGARAAIYIEKFCGGSSDAGTDG